jgi:hypothetical protein
MPIRPFDRQGERARCGNTKETALAVTFRLK